MDTSRLTREALARKKSKGERVGGNLPYGFRLAADGVHLEPDPEEARTVDMIMVLRACGLSLRAIGPRLAGLGRHPRSGGPWHPTTLVRILKSEALRRALP